MKHPKWELTIYSEEAIITTPQGEIIFPFENEREEWLRIVHLAAKAPEMYEALRGLVEVIDSHTVMRYRRTVTISHESYAKARVVLEALEGEM